MSSDRLHGAAVDDDDLVRVQHRREPVRDDDRCRAVNDTLDRLLDQALIRRTEKFLNELVWMARTLRHGRDMIALD